MMKITVSCSSEALGKNAAAFVAERLRSVIAAKGSARIVLSTGASQFTTLSALIQEDVDWSKVEMFHLDEYIGLPITHIASFRKYLEERFVSQVNLKAVHYVNGEGDVAENIRRLSEEITQAPIDIGLIGIGENAHIAFNDPPADFDVSDPYIIVNLNETCKQQQVGEGWFANVDEVPKQAISMSVQQIMKCECVVCCVPDARKAKAMEQTILSETVTNEIPATKLKEHSCVHIYLDSDSASLIDSATLEQFC